MKKNGLYLCVPLFLLIAYSYTNSVSPQYKATATIRLQGISDQEAISGLKSRYLVQKALSQLPFRVNYYDPKSHRREINADSLPVKFVFEHFNNVDEGTSIGFDVVNNNQFTLTNGDTIAYEEFGKTLNEFYGKFKVIHRPGDNYKNASFLFSFTDPVHLLDDYYNNLHVEPGDHGKTLAVSVLSGNPKKGAEFINKLLRLYGAAKPGVLVTTTVAQKDDPAKINKQIAALREKAARFRRHISWLSEKPKKAGVDSERMSAYNSKQFDLFKVMIPYIKKPAEEFVQVPHVDEVYDVELRHELNNYNAMQLHKQHLLASPEQNNVRIDTLDKKLMYLQSQIVENIAFLQQQHSPEAIPHANHTALLKLKQDSLANLEKEINAEKRRYAAAKVNTVKKITTAAGPRLTIIDKPENNIEYITVDSFLFYAIAFLAGILVPVAWQIIRNIRNNSRSARKANTQTVTDRLQDIFAVKQID